MPEEYAISLLEDYIRKILDTFDYLDPKIRSPDAALARLAPEQVDFQSAELLDVDVDGIDDPDYNDVFVAWTPSTGSIKMLTREVAEAITATTQTQLFTDSDQNRVLLAHGDAKAALQKLSNLEQLMLLQMQQREYGFWGKSTSSVLLNVDGAITPLLGFERVGDFIWPGFRRIIAPKYQQETLKDKYVCEARISRDGEILPHPNVVIDDEIATIEIGPLSLWATRNVRETGERSRKVPRSSSTSKSESVVSPRKMPNKQYMGQTKAAEVTDWAYDVEKDIDPNTVAPVAPEEEDDEKPRARRVIAVDSDDDSGDEDVPIKRLPATANTSEPDLSRDHLQDTSKGHASPPSTVLDLRVDDLERWMESRAAAPQDSHSNIGSQLVSDLTAAPERLLPIHGIAPSDLLRDGPSEFGPMQLGVLASPYSFDKHPTRSQIRQHEASSSVMPEPRHEHPLVALPLNERQASAAPNLMDDNASAQVTASVMPPSKVPSQLDASDVPDYLQPPDATSKEWVNHATHKPRKQSVLREHVLAQLQSDPLGGHSTTRAVHNGDWSTVSRSKPKKSDVSTRSRGRGRGGPQRKSDRSDLISYHSTMSQRAGNPGKKKNKTESKNKQKILDEAYGRAPTPRAQPKIPNRADRKLQEAANREATWRSKEVEQLKARLTPIFEASRAFCGNVEFGVHLGQVLLSSEPEVTKGKNFDVKAWESFFGLDAKHTTPSTSFTNIITTNGADIDRFLEMKSLESMSGKMFDREHPGPVSVTYEFHCRSKTGSYFILVVKEDKSYEMHNAVEMIGSVCMQCPARVWDACAAASGTKVWKDPSPEILSTIEEFVDSIYIGPDKEGRLEMFFRHPSGNILSVNSPQVRRVSQHKCLADSEIELRITEVKTLRTCPHEHDKKLFKAQEATFNDMVNAGALHYEACLLDTSINKAFEANRQLEIGELTNETTTGRTLLKTRTHYLIDLVVKVLNKIDYMGFHNRGTVCRQAEEQARREQSYAPTLQTAYRPIAPASHYVPSSTRQFGPAGTRMLPPGLMSSGIRSELPSEGIKPVPGTRMNSRAEIVQDENGNVYQIGLGGAKVPVVGAAAWNLQNISEEAIGPDDSASQAGGPRRFQSTGQGPWNVPNTRGAGFW